MANVRTIKIAALNIAMHQPHSAERYVSLFKDAKRLNHLVRLGTLHGAMLGALYGPSSKSASAELTGEIYRFVKLDPSEPWFNLETKEAASEGDVEAIKIPGHLLPHLQRIEFVFRPDVHQLWFVSQDRKDKMGPQAAEKFFQQLFDRVTAAGRYPQVEVTAIPDMDTLDEMLSLPVLERLTIELKRPNADDGAQDERRFLERLERQKASRIKTELIAVKGESIAPDDETRALAAVASHNGNVSVTGRDAGGTRVEESTVAKPLLIPEKVDSDKETSADVLMRTALNH